MTHALFDLGVVVVFKVMQTNSKIMLLLLKRYICHQIYTEYKANPHGNNPYSVQYFNEL